MLDWLLLSGGIHGTAAGGKRVNRRPNVVVDTYFADMLKMTRTRSLKYVTLKTPMRGLCSFHSCWDVSALKSSWKERTSEHAWGRFTLYLAHILPSVHVEAFCVVCGLTLTLELYPHYSACGESTLSSVHRGVSYFNYTVYIAFPFCKIPLLAMGLGDAIQPPPSPPVASAEVVVGS